MDVVDTSRIMVARAEEQEVDTVMAMAQVVGVAAQVIEEETLVTILDEAGIVAVVEVTTIAHLTMSLHSTELAKRNSHMAVKLHMKTIRRFLNPMHNHRHNSRCRPLISITSNNSSNSLQLSNTNNISSIISSIRSTSTSLRHKGLRMEMEDYSTIRRIVSCLGILYLYSFGVFMPIMWSRVQ